MKLKIWLIMTKNSFFFEIPNQTLSIQLKQTSNHILGNGFHFHCLVGLFAAHIVSWEKRERDPLHNHQLTTLSPSNRDYFSSSSFSSGWQAKSYDQTPLPPADTHSKALEMAQILQ